MNVPTSALSLEDLLRSKGDLVEYFYNDTLAPHSRARAGLTPVPAEHTTWIDEQRAWRETAVIFDQSHHMPELFVRGPDALKLLSKIGINSLKSFGPGRARQFIGCNPHGQVIGESILYFLEDGTLELVSGMPLQNWVVYQAEVGGYDVELERDAATSANSSGKRIKFRFGMDGPNAHKIWESVIEGDVPEIPFFRTGKARIAGCEVMALRHGMAGHKGVEISGKFEDGPAVRAALLEAGKKFGLKQGGQLAYFSTIAESSWSAAPLPAVFTSPELRAYRQWLPANSWESTHQLGGSFVSDNLEDYYVTPWDLGVERNLKFDHDFIGAEALAEMARKPLRTRRTLIWNKQDVARVFSSMFDAEPFKMMRLPVSTFAYQQNDAVRTKDGALAGISGFCGYTANEREYVSLARLNLDQAEIGQELVLTWGEPNGGSRKPHVERHRQTEIRVKVAPAPFAETVRKIKHETVG